MTPGECSSAILLHHRNKFSEYMMKYIFAVRSPVNMMQDYGSL